VSAGLILLNDNSACLLVLQGLAQIGRLLVPHGVSRAEAAGLIRLNENMGRSSLEAFGQSLSALLRGLGR
jgi:hypothetical protein